MSLSALRLVFMGTPEFAVPTLERLVERGAQVVGVVSQPARPKGRGQQVEQTPVGQAAERHGLPLFQWPKLNNESYATLKALAPDVCVVVAYGKILPKRYLELPPQGCFNGHASLLPALRGAAPIQWAVLRGHTETGISVMRMDEGLDTGDVALTLSTAIGPDETSGELHDRLSSLSADAISQALDALLAGRLTLTPQDHALATLAPLLNKDVGRVDFSQPASAVHNQIRGAAPWPGAFVERAEGPLKLRASRLAEGNGAPGVVIGHEPDGPRVACGQGAVVLTELQRPGRRPVDGAAFLRGQALPLGSRLCEGEGP